MFDSLKKIFNRSSRQEEKYNEMALIDEEIDQFEKELQDSITSMDRNTSPVSVQQPDSLGRGGAIGGQSLITPEAQKRVKES